MPIDLDAGADAPATPCTRLHALFDAPLCHLAQQLIDRGAVANVRVLQSGRVVTGVVDERQRVYIEYSRAEIDRFEGECSCGELGPCVHVAAVMMTAAVLREASADLRPPVVSVPPLSAPGVEHSTLPRQALSYLVEPVRDGGSRLSVWVTHLLTDGRVQAGATRFAARTSPGVREYPRYVDSHDREILTLLKSLAGDEPWALAGVGGFELLQRVVVTGRAFWRSLPGTPSVAAPHALRQGTALAVRFAWRILHNGDQRMMCDIPVPFDLLLELEPAVYIVEPGRCGLLELSYPSSLLRQFWDRAAIDPNDVPAVIAELAADLHASAFPRPRQLTLQSCALLSLRARLVLSAAPAADLEFLYNDVVVGDEVLRAREGVVRQWDGHVINEIPRNLGLESALRAQLQEFLPAFPREEAEWLAFMLQGVPALQALGWEIHVEPDFPFRIVTTDSWYADLQTTAPPRRGAGAAHEWFDLRLGVRVEGRSVNLLPALVSYLQGAGRENARQHDALSLLVGEHLLVRLDDGRYLPMPLTRVRRIAETLVELSDQECLNGRQALSLPATQAGRLAPLVLDADAPAVESDTPSLLKRIEAIKGFTRIEPLAAPVNFPVTLRPYQAEGLGWLQFMRRHGLGGILADDMGLGKTVQTLAHLVTEKQQGRLRNPSLIVAPVSVLANWQHELRRFAPDLSLVILHGAQRKERFASLATADIVLIGYPLLVIERESLLERDFCFVILDEAQTIKNPHAKVTQVAQALRAEHRLCLTGTPMENHLGELWSLLHFVQPDLLGDRRQFQQLYRTPIEIGGDAERAAALGRRVQPFLLRRTKDAVARDLPPKVEMVQAIELEESQRDFYDGIRLGQHRRVREAIEQQGLARSQLTVLNALLKLRQACCDPRLVDANASIQIPSAKLEWLSAVLPQLIAEGRRILLFSQFTSMLSLIETRVNELAISYCLLTGESRHRSDVVERFQAGDIPLFLISLKAGGTGLNLTAADTVIHYDPWWNPAVEAQATDRAHRIGQDKPVFVYKLIAQGTIEEKIRQLQADKHALVSQLYSAGNATPTQMTSADLDSLFAS